MDVSNYLYYNYYLLILSLKDTTTFMLLNLKKEKLNYLNQKLNLKQKKVQIINYFKDFYYYYYLIILMIRLIYFKLYLIEEKLYFKKILFLIIFNV